MPRLFFIRFVTAERHPPYGHRTGVFQAAYRLARCDQTAPDVRRQLEDTLSWFRTNLPVPDRFTASRDPAAVESCVSWLRADAVDHLHRLREVVTLLDREGIATEELRTARPGYVVYEDNVQVVALPFKDTPA